MDEGGEEEEDEERQEVASCFHWQVYLSLCVYVYVGVRQISCDDEKCVSVVKLEEEGLEEGWDSVLVGHYFCPCVSSFLPGRSQ